MATAAATFTQTWRVGRRVQEKAPPHRRGSVRARRGSGQNAVLVVNLDGRAPQNFRPAQLTPL
jgi:hypothetical protein